MQWHCSDQVHSACWILDEGEAAVQQVSWVKVPDVAWVMPRLIHVPVNASLGLQQDQSCSLATALAPSLSLSTSTSDCWGWLVKRSSAWNHNFGCSPCRHSEQRLSNLDLLPPCYIYELRRRAREFYWWISKTHFRFTTKSLHPTFFHSLPWSHYFLCPS